MQAAEVLNIHDRATQSDIAINLGSKAAHIPDSSALEHGTTAHISDVCMPDMISGMHTCLHLLE